MLGEFLNCSTTPIHPPLGVFHYWDSPFQFCFSLTPLNDAAGMATMEWRKGVGVDGSIIDWIMLPGWIFEMLPYWITMCSRRCIWQANHVICSCHVEKWNCDPSPAWRTCLLHWEIHRLRWKNVCGCLSMVWQFQISGLADGAGEQVHNFIILWTDIH